MRSNQLREEMAETITAGHSLREIVSILRQYQRRGIARDEIQLALEALRAQTRDEVTEDRILEVMDVVSGFCSLENTVWGK